MMIAWQSKLKFWDFFRSPFVLVAACVSVAPINDLLAQSPPDFRIETDVMLANEAEPIIQTLTIFQGGIAYDYSRNEPKRVTIIHPAKNRIIFLDEDRELQSQINLNDLQAFIERARIELANTSLKEFLRDCEIVNIDDQSQTVVVGHRTVRYEAKYQAIQRSEAAQLYSDFANASAYINSWQAPDRNPPSFARVQLNKVLGQRNAIPIEITRTTFTNDGHEHILRSRLHVSWQLTQEDQKLVQKFQSMLTAYRTEQVGEFMAPTKIGSSGVVGSSKTVQR